MKALVSSFDRRHDRPTILPLTVILQEVIDWIELASGVEAWAKPLNRRSLRADFNQSTAALGPALANCLSSEIAVFSAAFIALDQSKRDASGSRILEQAAGLRTDTTWLSVEAAAKAVLSGLATDAAIEASWADLVATSQTTTLERREYRAIADLLFEQLRLRECEATTVFRDVVEMLASGRSPVDDRSAEKALSPIDRLDAARLLILDVPAHEHVVVWLGYVGARVDHVVAGSVIFMDAHWYVPNATMDRHEFVGKDELAEIVGWSMFSVAERVDEPSDVDLLARVDLGTTAVSGAADRAQPIVDALLSLSVHWSGGVRPLLTQTVVVHDGVLGESTIRAHHATVSDDHYGANITRTAISEFAPQLGAAMATAELPHYLAAAVDVQTAADVPFSRELALREPTDADLRGVLPLEDRVVQHISAYAGLGPNDIFAQLARRWPHSRWVSDVEKATRMCLLGSGPNARRVNELRGQFYGSTAKKPWYLFVADNAAELLTLLRVESERGWVTRMFRSLSDPMEYAALTSEYEVETAVLADRRVRVRNALVHGNPASMPVVQSVAKFASYLSRYALRVGLDSFTTGDTVQVILDREYAEHDPLKTGTSATDFWRARAAQAAAP